MIKKTSTNKTQFHKFRDVISNFSLFQFWLFFNLSLIVYHQFILLSLEKKKWILNQMKTFRKNVDKLEWIYNHCMNINDSDCWEVMLLHCLPTVNCLFNRPICHFYNCFHHWVHVLVDFQKVSWYQWSLHIVWIFYTTHYSFKKTFWSQNIFLESNKHLLIYIIWWEWRTPIYWVTMGQASCKLFYILTSIDLWYSRVTWFLEGKKNTKPYYSYLFVDIWIVWLHSAWISSPGLASLNFH